MGRGQVAGFSVDALKVQESDGKNSLLLEGFTYTTLKGEVIDIPAGSESDGASTPQFMWNLLPSSGDYWMAAFLHDYLYRYSDKPRGECDSLLKEAMYRLGVNKFKANIIYLGVRMGGWLAYRSSRKARIQKAA